MNPQEYEQLKADIDKVKNLYPDRILQPFIQLAEEHLAAHDPAKKPHQFAAWFLDLVETTKKSLGQLECTTDVLMNQGTGNYLEEISFLRSIGIDTDEFSQMQDSHYDLITTLEEWEGIVQNWQEENPEAEG